MKTNLSWKSKMQFISTTRGHENILDANLESGGLNSGANPKEYLLQGIAGCSGMDAIFYLNKHKQIPLRFDIEVEADLTEKTLPIYFKEIRLKYKILGDHLDRKKVINSVEKSMTKYCGVSFMVYKTSPILYTIELNGETIFEGKAKFADS